MFKLEQNNNEVVGLDIGSSSVKMTQLRKDDTGYSVVAAAKADIINGSGPALKANIINAIGQCFKTTSIETRNAVCGLCGPDVVVRGFKFPPVPQEQIEQAVLLEARQVCPLDLDSSTVDYQVITSNGQQNTDSTAPKAVKGILVVATNKAIQRITQLTAEALTTCVMMDVDDLALLNCFAECEKPDTNSAIAVIDVGKSFATLSILGNDGIPFIRTFTNEMTAEADSFDSGGGVESPSQKLIVGINETLRYYSMQPEASPIERIFVCGGFALAEDFIELLDRNLFVKAQAWNPFSKMRCNHDIPGADLLKTAGPAMAVAAGLAMRSI